MMFVYINDQDKRINAWNELQTKSSAHDILVGAYLGCRKKVFSAGSIEECQLVVKDYAELKGLKGELPIVLEDISSLSQAVLNDEL